MMPPFKKPLFLVFVAAAALAASGCSVVGVKMKAPSAAWTTVRQQAKAKADDGAGFYLRKAALSATPKDEKLSLLLKAAQLTQDAQTGSSDHKINQAATTGIIKLMQARDFEPVRLGEGRLLTVSDDSATTLDPRTADELLLASSVRIRGLRTRTAQDGAGVPCVARLAPKSPALRGQPGITPLAGICEPVTALVRFDGKNPALTFYRTLKKDEARVNGRKTRLAADFSAPLAYMVYKGQNRLLSIREMFFPDINRMHVGLYQFSTYDPDKIPVILVHGLMSRPETWVPAINELLGDREIRERFQFWLFIYPTGLPVWTSAAKLRAEIIRYRATLDPQGRNRNFRRMVLAGHSMGGLISGMQIRTGGKYLWRQFLNTPPEQLDISPAMKEHLIRIVEFRPRPEIARVVFFATPHRGSYLASRSLVEFTSRLVRLPFDFLRTDFADMQQFFHKDARRLFATPANSLVFLRARSPLLKAILELPMKRGVPYHSIIGDRGRGDTPDSSDGVVPYWSSHLEGAASEKIVPSGHGTNENPEGIGEFRRILLLHSRAPIARQRAGGT